ncbi:MAG: branched-chain amino acid ABC transporter permease [Armatimonadota bacterium]|nr:branched-chain amino acid ABC transporter permease [Armatimonadota bacterium]MDR5702924.1 branched-chain amino acid ABC transporter permease [Armatimonadota bacterium]
MTSNLAILFVSAVLVAGVYATMSYGLALIFGVMKVINLSHAGAIMLGAYVAYVLIVGLKMNPFIAAVVVVPPLFFLLGILLERVFVRPVRKAPPIASLLLLFGVWLMMQNIAYIIWTGEVRTITTPYTMMRFNLGAVPINVNRLAVFLVGVFTLLALHQFMTRTYLGKAIRATAQDSAAAKLAGINTDQIDMVAFGLGTALAGMAGALTALIYAFDPNFGGSYMLKSFCIVVLGGVESFLGVALGSLILALAETLSVLWIRAGLQDFVSFVILVLALLVMPGGLPELFQRRFAVRQR